LTDTVSRYWDRQKENDLVRFVHLASTGAEHMLYATRLTKYMVLALIFDAETPFSTIHTQANQLAHSLSTSPSEKQDDLTQGALDVSPASAFPSPNLPAPEAQHHPAYAAGQMQAKLDAKYGAQKNSGEFKPALTIDAQASAGETETFIALEHAVESPSVARKNNFRNNTAEQAEAEETRPNPRNEAARRIILEPITPAVYNLDYACLLVPRFPSHHLIGDLSDYLPDWMQETCIAFGWRLEYISVRPEYLLWNVNVPPATSPAYLMRIMHQRISVKIFDNFPRLQNENPSGDFFAPGYLIMGGSHPVPIEVIKQFIAQTRQRQGIPPQSR
jgi:REP element-mobilizing transposase RayT